VRTGIVSAFGFLLGLGLWLGSHAFTGTFQPWSSSRPTYVFVLFGVGLLLGVLNPDNFGYGPLGLYVGEALALASQGYLVSPTDPPTIYPIACLFLASYSLAAFGGAAVSAAALRIPWRAAGAASPPASTTSGAEGPPATAPSPQA
jgi:hypothetical protein